LTSHSLSQDKLDNIGLIEAIEFEGNRITRNNSYNKIFATINKQAVYNFTQEQSVYLFRIFQEIMGNILNHSKATLVSITIDLITNNTFYLCVEDNGIGFNISEKQKSKLSGIGLSGMKKRALQIGASFKLESTLQKGTTITIELPLPLLPNTATKKNEKSTYSFD
jgi:signal transduction histidine kinase